MESQATPVKVQVSLGLRLRPLGQSTAVACKLFPLHLLRLLPEREVGPDIIKLQSRHIQRLRFFAALQEEQYLASSLSSSCLGCAWFIVVRLRRPSMAWAIGYRQQRSLCRPCFHRGLEAVRKPPVRHMISFMTSTPTPAVFAEAFFLNALMLRVRI